MEFNSIILHKNFNNKLATEKIFKSNETSIKFEIVLKDTDILNLLEVQSNTLKSLNRIEFGTGIIDKLNLELCDSAYVRPSQYEEILEYFIELFYYLKNECFDILSDDELIKDIRTAFDNSHGSLFLTGDILLKDINKRFKNKSND